MSQLTKTIYEVIGRTKANNYVCSGWCSSPKLALAAMLVLYPRFMGRATLFEKIVEDHGEGLLISDMARRGREITMFNSAKEIKAVLKDAALLASFGGAS